MLSNVTADTITDAQIHVVRKAMLGVPRKNSYHRAILADCGGALNGSRACRESVARAYNQMRLDDDERTVPTATYPAPAHERLTAGAGPGQGRRAQGVPVSVSGPGSSGRNGRSGLDRARGGDQRSRVEALRGPRTRDGVVNMKALPEILRDVLLLLKEGRESVVIARGHSHEPLDGRSVTYQIRICRDADLNRYKCETRGWLGEQWSSWHAREGWLGGAGFDIDDVLASDWRIAS